MIRKIYFGFVIKNGKMSFKLFNDHLNKEYNINWIEYV